MPSSNRRPTTSRADASARARLLGMLEEDHKRAKHAFREFEKLDPQTDAEACEAIVRQTLAELKLHTALEEELLYPAAREALDDEGLIDEAEVEHASAKSLIRQLDDMTPADDKYGATFTVLGEYVNHHIKEEEKEMFPALRRAKADWQALCDEVTSRRAELQPQLLPEGARAEGASRRPPSRGAAEPAGLRRPRSGDESRPMAADEPDED
jgi:hemerythrin-like domain-containing protein